MINILLVIILKKLEMKNKVIPVLVLALSTSQAQKVKTSNFIL